MNTGMTDYLQQLITHATKQRHSAASEGMQNETIVVSDMMSQMLDNMPHVSSKYLTN
jgi:Na+/H+ antiporter NhaD/arsenite permease-like protein